MMIHSTLALNAKFDGVGVLMAAARMSSWNDLNWYRHSRKRARCESLVVYLNSCGNTETPTPVSRPMGPIHVLMLCIRHKNLDVAPPQALFGSVHKRAGRESDLEGRSQ